MAYNDYDDNEQEGHGVDALQRFMTDQQTPKLLQSIIAAYSNSLHDNDEDMEAADIPEISRNDKVLLLKGIFELCEEVLGDTIDSDEVDEGDEEYAAMKRRKEIAKDKRMSVFYKAFMGDMRDLVNPWFGDRNGFIAKWADMGNNLYERSPAKASKHPLKLVAKEVQTDEEPEEETAAIVGAEAALPSGVARELAELGFVPVPQPDTTDAAWMRRGTEDAFPDRSVYLIRREEGSYLVLLSQDSPYDRYGKPLKRQLLSADVDGNTILRVLAFMYDAMAAE